MAVEVSQLMMAGLDDLVMSDHHFRRGWNRHVDVLGFGDHVHVVLLVGPWTTTALLPAAVLPVRG